MIIEIFLILIAYLWGSIPYGYIITKKKTGKNILEFGSKNIGSTNVRRIAGRKMSVLTQLLDMLKGILPIFLLIILDRTNIYTPHQLLIYSIALSTIIGHNYSIFLNFKGGKGVNTSLGASLLLNPYPVLISVAIYYIVKLSFKYVSLGSIFIGISLPLSEYLIKGINLDLFYLLLVGAFIIFRHKSNIGRLIHKNEIL